MKTFFRLAAQFVARILLVPTGIIIAFLAFFDDYGALLSLSIDKVATFTHIPTFIPGIVLLGVWIILKAMLLLCGTTCVLKAFQWKVPYRRLFTDLLERFADEKART